MENATKALVIAAEVIISVMIIATLIYAYSTWSTIPEAQDQTLEAKQLAAFNQQYESYDRDALYGTDLVSVLNKAIDNNKRNGVSHGEKMFINIGFTINTSIDAEKTVYRMYTSGEYMGETKIHSTETLENVLSEGTYFLANSSNTINDFLTKFYGSKIEGKSRKDEKGKYIEYTETIAGGSEFKSRIFKCTKVTYDDEGRINYMKFEEQEVNV